MNSKKQLIILILGALLSVSCITNVSLLSKGDTRTTPTESPSPSPSPSPIRTRHETPLVSNVMATKYKYVNTIYRIITDDYDGEYDRQMINDTGYELEKEDILSYEEYKEYCKKYNINQKYTDKNQRYIIYSNRDLKEGFRLANISYQEDEVFLFVWKNCEKEDSKNQTGVLIIPIKNKMVTHVTIEKLYTQEDFEKQKEYIEKWREDIENGNIISVKKPVIYIYPEKEQEVEVKLLNDNRLLHSYPKYENSWKVVASPDGNLKEKNKNRNYYALYYESKSKNIKETEEGFIVEKENITKFLEEKLEILGLNEKEQEEFIIYWLPRLEQNKYVYIRFANKEEIEENMKLEINPKPKTLIRVMMVWKGLEEKKEVKEQKLEKVKRKGYTIVEWGGTELKD